MNEPSAYILDTATLQWTKIPAPEVVNRVYHKAVWLEDSVCVLGGAQFQEGTLVSPFNDIILWNIPTQSIGKISADFPLWGFCPLLDLLLNKVVMVGGVTTGDQ